jgi:hypothetical protein
MIYKLFYFNVLQNYLHSELSQKFLDPNKKSRTELRNSYPNFDIVSFGEHHFKKGQLPRIP